MKTTFLLMAQYDGRAIIPVDLVCRDYFPHLGAEKFLRKALTGEIPIPVTRLDSSQKGMKGVHLTDLAAYIDQRAEAARRELAQMIGK